MAFDEPKWQKELRNFKGIKSLFVLEKNLGDIYPIKGIDGTVSFGDMQSVIRSIMVEDAEAPYRMVCYHPVSRFAFPSIEEAQGLDGYLKLAEQKATEMKRESDEINALGAQCGQAGQAEPALVHDARVIRTMITEGFDGTGVPSNPTVVLLDMASRLVSPHGGEQKEEMAAFVQFQMAAMHPDTPQYAEKPGSNGANTLILLVDNLRDLPEWFIRSGSILRSIVVPMPDRDLRKLFVASTYPDAVKAEAIALGFDPNAEPCGRADSPTRETSAGKSDLERFIDKTDGMSLRELDEIGKMYFRDYKDSALDGAALCALVDVYKYGIKENKWASFKDILARDPEGWIKTRVIGQDDAVSKVVTVLRRSALGLSGATHSSSGKPKGILFLAGPTGTGKTELVKRVTELLFGDERNMLRFDMSEYREDNSDQKLFGAPPGYVGYSEGGQLTNAVRANPFSVLLFDEVEKASSSIMDKFLQILEDGRMTDGQGNTVYFSETIIFFTSNIGFSEEVINERGETEIRPTVSVDDSPERVVKVAEAAYEKAFKAEFRGRIGKNFVVFDVIRPGTAQGILDKQLRQIAENVESQHGIRVEVTEECRVYLLEKASGAEYLNYGGRGIGNMVEEHYLNWLSDRLFSHSQDVSSGGVITVSADEGGLTWEISA